MLLELPRTLLRPVLFPLQSSPLPLHLLTTAQLPLTPLSRPGLLPQSELTPESLPRSPTLSHKSMSRNTTLMSPLLSHVPFPVRSLSTST